jgi:predicted RNase H-like HicB family nuclease
MKYSVVLHKDPQSDYSVTVRDLPGCFSAGNTIEEALSMAREAIECHLEGMLLDGDPIPKSQSIEEHQANPEYRDGIWGIVELDMSKLSSKSKQVNITLPEYLLKDTAINSFPL